MSNKMNKNRPVVEIIPAILPRDFAELEEKLELVKGFTEIVQIDVCDGQFVANATWPYRKRDDSFEKIVLERDGLPGWESLDYEIDLMTNRPEEIVDDWIAAGASRMIIHAEAAGDIVGTVSKFHDRVEIGMAFNMETPIVLPDGCDGKIGFIQCMGIDRIGFQGQPYDPKVADKIGEAKDKYPDIRVSVDGGVSLDNVEQLIRVGADKLVVGSAIFDSDDPIGMVRRFAEIAKSSAAS